MKIHRIILIYGVLAWSMVANGRAEYIANVADPNITNDFQYAQIGEMGSAPTANNRMFVTNGILRLDGAYAQQVSRYLRVSDDGSGLNDGRYTQSVTASVTFTYFNGDSTNVAFIMGMRSYTNAGAHNRPTYRALITNNVFALHKVYDSAYPIDIYTNLGSFAISENLGSTNVYQLNFAAVDTGTNAWGDIVDVTASLYENGVLLSSHNFLDIPATKSTYNISNSYDDGFIGIAAGATTTNNVARGINVSAFRVIDMTSSGDGDADHDGIADAWEVTWCGGNCDPAGNTGDGDPYSYQDEYVLDSNPTVSNSFDIFAIVSISPMTFQFVSTNSRSYSVDYSTNLTIGTNWASLVSPHLGSNGVFTVTDPAADTRRSYRVRVALP
jgi:hypothetical protein